MKTKHQIKQCREAQHPRVQGEGEQDRVGQGCSRRSPLQEECSAHASSIYAASLIALSCFNENVQNCVCGSFASFFQLKIFEEGKYSLKTFVIKYYYDYFKLIINNYLVISDLRGDVKNWNNQLKTFYLFIRDYSQIGTCKIRLFDDTTICLYIVGRATAS